MSAGTVLSLNEKQTQLWASLSRMKLDPPQASIQFIDKLIRETGWTRAFAARAIEEYRRFLLIAATAGHPVSPSETVDQVWHTHLLYTRSYWAMCREMLGFEFHHEPAIGTSADREKLDDWYARTLQSYESIFGEIPRDIWPATPVANSFRRVDEHRNVVVPRNMVLAIGGLIVAIVLGSVVVAWFT